MLNNLTEKYKRLSQIEKWLLWLLLLAFFVRVLGANLHWIDGDEGNYLYDAMLLGEGLNPFSDYYCRSQAFLLLLSLSQKIFGATLWSGRFVPVLAGTGSVWLVFELGKRFFDSEKQAFWAAAFMALTPFTIFWSTVIKTEPVSVFFCLLALYFCLRWQQEGGQRWAFLHAVTICGGFFVRQSTAVILVAELCYLAQYELADSERSWGQRFRSWGQGMGVFLAPFAGFGLLAGLALLASGKDLSLDFHYMISQHLTRVVEKINIFAPQMVAGQVRPSQFTQFNAIWRIEHLSREMLPLILPAAIALASRYGRKAPVWRRWLLAGLVLAGFFAFARFYSAAYFSTSRFEHPWAGHLIYLAGVVLGAFVAYYLFCDRRDLSFNRSSLLLFWSLLGLICAYFTYAKTHLMYLYELSPYLALLAGWSVGDLVGDPRPIVAGAEDRWRKYLGWVLIAMLLVLGGDSLYFYYHDSPTHGLFRDMSPAKAYQVADYVRENTEPGQAVFTGNIIFPFLAERRVWRNITHPIVYYSGGLDERFYPKMPELIAGLEADKLPLIVVDRRTQECYLSRHPMLVKYLQSQYRLAETVAQDVYMLRRNF